MTEGFMTLDKMNTIEFDSTHLWSISFPDAPSPFNDWFPAQSCDDDVYNVVTDTFDVGNTDMVLPTGLSSKSIHMEVLDAVDCRLEKWIENWVNNEMFVTEGKSVGANYLDNICKKCNITKYDYQHNVIYKKQHTVHPIGTMKHSRTSDANAKVLSLDFKIQSSRDLS